MKIILSRKGFDSKAGGIPSPIFPNGDMISFPIPDAKDSDKYADLQYTDENNNKYSYERILDNLYSCKNTKYCKEMKKNLSNLQCHLDPDIDKTRRSKGCENWEPLFGQIDQTGKYLKSNIKNLENEDYLFLFFGWFHKVKQQNEKFVYEIGKNKDLHIIWGYLLVNEMLTDTESQRKKSWHPHSKYVENDSNVIFTAKKAGLFNKFDDKLLLTDKNSSRAVWKYNEVYAPKNVLKLKNGEQRKNSATDTQKNIFYKGQWQELFLINSDLCQNWAEELCIL